MLSSGIIFEYVWQHFCSLYPEAQNLEVTYGENLTPGKVSISSHGAGFFEKSLAFPEAITWLTWEDTQIPFLFPPQTENLISETPSGEMVVQADIIAGAFYFLSNWQEYHSPVRDRFNRFPYAESLQAKHGFVTLPVVNYYFLILKTALEKSYGINLKNEIWGDQPFVTFLSHDVDRLESAWKVEGKKQLLAGRLRNFANLVFQKFLQKDHWHNLEKVSETVKKFGAVSTFFWLPQKGKFQNHPNADYELSNPEFRKMLAGLEKAGFENGIHGSFGTSTSVPQFQNEMAKVPAQVQGNRFHYLSFDPQKTPEVLASAGVAYDSTLGFAEHFGFRNAYCFPFRLFDFANQKLYPFLEIPLNLMDASLWHPNYLKLKPEEILPAISPMLLEIKKFGGCFGLLWHNENFSELNPQNGLAAFEKIMQELTEIQSGFQTGNQIAYQFKSRFLAKKPSVLK